MRAHLSVGCGEGLQTRTCPLHPRGPADDTGVRGRKRSLWGGGGSSRHWGAQGAGGSREAW